MIDQAILELADAAGIAVTWRDVEGVAHEVALPTVQAVLEALGYRTASHTQIRESLLSLRELPASLPPLVTARVGQKVILRAQPARTRLVLEDGRIFDGHAESAAGGAALPAILEPGYHTLFIGEQLVTLAVAPDRCTTVRDLLPGGRALTLAAQIYALRRQGDAGIGDFAALGDFVEAAARHGVDGIAISPVHAQFSADPNRFGPYAPSSRVALNALHAPVDLYPGHDDAWQTRANALEALEFVDWPAAAEARLNRLVSIFGKVERQRRWSEPFQAFRAAQGQGLERHAIFETLHEHFFRADPNLWNWRQWPEQFRSPDSPAVIKFAAEHSDRVDFHVFLQFLADRGLADAQRRARNAGMAIGLISDLAVGTDGGGSHCWSRPRETLLGLTIGAPPDMFQRAGQNWGLAAFSPSGLVSCGFAAFLEMLRAALSHAGGVRIDHSMGLHRLWVIPEGAGATEGAYLRFPETDLFNLITLESHRSRAIVVAEDLGTLPDGFQDRLQNAGIAGMRVLWFERGTDRHFTPPGHWTHQAAAMTTTHDLPTVAGWWQGRDIDWRATLEPDLSRADADSERARDRHLLWEAMQRTESTRGEQPAPGQPASAVDAAIVHVARSACDIMILPVEDVLGLPEQPNLPNTIEEHPNWRRRLPGMAATLLDDETAAGRLSMARNGRKA